MPQLILLMTVLMLATPPAAVLAKDTGTTRYVAAATFAASEPGRFSSAERNLIRAWLREAQRHETNRQPAPELQPGLEKKAAHGKPLPPGWQKKLARGEHLERDYYYQGVALPDDLLRRLPPPPPGSEILQIEDRIIRLDAASRTIIDVFGLGGE
jgi:Ni/Co efflux regulator RcnB